jgi:hypothetical protein
MIGCLLCGFGGVALLASNAIAQLPDGKSRPGDDRAALQRSMIEFKRGVGGTLTEKSLGRETGVGQFQGRPTISRLRIGTSVSVPDGGETLLGGISNASTGKNSAGLHPLQNRASGKEISKTSASARVWVIIFSEEEERQTGYSPRK